MRRLREGGRHSGGIGLEPQFTVIGVDPGLTRMGYGVVQESRGTLTCICTGTLTTFPGPAPARLEYLYASLSEIIRRYPLDAMAVEKVFLKANAKTGVGAIQASGIALLAGAVEGLGIAEYSPAQVKQVITGVGTAVKGQVRFMVGNLLAGAAAPDTPDAADALAVAITHVHSRPVINRSGSGWRQGASQ